MREKLKKKGRWSYIWRIQAGIDCYREKILNISTISTKKKKKCLNPLTVRVSFIHITLNIANAWHQKAHHMLYQYNDDKCKGFCISNHLKSFSEDDTDYIAQPKPSTYSFSPSWKLFYPFFFCHVYCDSMGLWEWFGFLSRARIEMMETIPYKCF